MQVMQSHMEVDFVVEIVYHAIFVHVLHATRHLLKEIPVAETLLEQGAQTIIRKVEVVVLVLLVVMLQEVHQEVVLAVLDLI